MNNEFQLNSNGEFDYSTNIGDEIRDLAKGQSSKMMVWQPDGSFATIEAGSQPREGTIVTEMARKAVWY